VKPEQAVKVMMWMPIRLKTGEGSTGGRDIDTRTRFVRRDNGLGALEG
jgi:hypothetical protein